VIAYSFLGQKGKGNVGDFVGVEQTVFNNMNTGAVFNNATAPAFTISKACAVTYLSTYHWNSGNGTTAPGQLSLKDQSGRVYGPWKTKGVSGQGGVKNASWECIPGVLIQAGTYTVIDSIPATWSQNAASGGKGFTEVLGKY
jgi:hypothetical protein